MNKHFIPVQHLDKKQNNRYNTKSGFSLLIGVIIIGSVGLTLVLGLSSLSRVSVQMGLVVSDFLQAQAYANTCAERALQRIRDTTSYTGTDSMTLSRGSCEYVVTDIDTDVKEIQSTGTSRESVRRVEIQTSSLSPQIIIESWQEVADF